MVYELIFWFMLLFIFLVAELLTMNLTSVWFCIGALASMLLAALGSPLAIQVIVFILVSVLMLLFTKPFVHKVLPTKFQATNMDRIIDSFCIVIEEINNLKNTGFIKFEGKEFRARTLDENLTVSKGEKVIARKIEGVTVYVEYKKGA